MGTDTVQTRGTPLPQEFCSHTLDNGLTLVAEKMPGVRSAAMTLMTPAGASVDPAGRLGTANVTAELVFRGAGDRDSHQLTDHLDRLGLQRSSSASVLHTRFGCAALSANVMAGLDTYADILRRARLPDDGFGPAVDLAVQGLAGIDDDPRHKLSILLQRNPLALAARPQPDGRDGRPGTVDTRRGQKFLRDPLPPRRHDPGGRRRRRFRVPERQGRHAVRRLGKTRRWPPSPGPAGRRRYVFEEQKTEQTHIGLAYDTVDETHPDYYPARLATEVLSGGMSGRLFTEIREKKRIGLFRQRGLQQLPPAARRDHGLRRHEQRAGPADARPIPDRARPPQRRRDGRRTDAGQDRPQEQHDHERREQRQPRRGHRPRPIRPRPVADDRRNHRRDRRRHARPRKRLPRRPPAERHDRRDRRPEKN